MYHRFVPVITNQRRYDRETIARYGTPAFLLGDPDPLNLTQSGLRQNYLDVAGTTPASASTDTVALQLDRSQGAAIGAELLGAGSWSVTGSASEDAGTITFPGGAATAGKGAGAAGTFYDLYMVIARASGTLTVKCGSTTLASVTASGEYRFKGLWTSTGNVLALSTSDFVGTVSLTSGKSIAGYHFYQATSADEPTLTKTGSLWSYVGDGTSKHFLNGLLPTASSTLMIAVKANAVSDYMLGAASGANRFALLTDGSGLLEVAAGSTLAPVGNDIRGIPGIAALTVSGANYRAIWKPITGAAQSFTGTFAGSIPTTVPIWLGTLNNGGSPSTAYLNGTWWRALAQQSAYTDGEIAAIANQWSRELVGAS